MLTPEIVKKALEQIRKRPANHDYFFSKLTSADWIGPLDEAGLFSSPPAALREGDTISFPFWPESQYLERIASKAPEQVAAVMMKILETDNVRVHEDLAHIAAKLPTSLTAQWVRKEITWVEQQDHLYLLLPEALGELIEHLATSRELWASLALAKAVLAIRLVGDGSKRAFARFDAWHYEQLLQKNFPAVLQQAGFEALTLLCDFLEDALDEESDGSDEDYSWIWRPAIEPHPQNQGHGGVRDVLIDAIRDGSLQLIKNGFALQDVTRALLGRRCTVFKRLAVYLHAENHEHQAARDFALEREYFFDERLQHEYSRLIGAVFSFLEKEGKNTILSWIENGPSRGLEDDEDEELRRKRKAYWQAQRLFGLRGQLPDEWEQHYSKIVIEVGEPEHPDFASYITTWTGPTTPKEAPELEKMSTEDIALFLKNWKPGSDRYMPAPEGLGRVLQTVVAKSAERFVTTLDAFHDVDPTYARALVQGFNDAAKAGHSIEWKGVLDYLEYIVRQPRIEVRESNGRIDKDTHWGWARKAVGSLLSVAFEKNAIGISLREPAWRIIDTIADDPDPTMEDDQKSTMDPATRSINTTRGESLHAVMRYALWVRREVTGNGLMSEQSSFDMNTIPEVRDLLERHLDPAIDPSPSIRAVFGQWFPWLSLLDASWAEAKVESIFPAKNPGLRDAAWNTYLVFCPVNNELFRILRGQYSDSVDRLRSKSESNTKWFGKPSERLGEHLLVMLGRGVIDWSDEDGLVKKFFNNATTADATNAVAFVGRSFHNESTLIPDEVVERFRRFWEELASYVSTGPADRAQLLKSFGWWFASRCFDAMWAFDQVDRVIETTGGIEPDFMVMERLADLASKHATRSLKVLKALARRDDRGWNVLGWKDSAMVILSTALAAEATKSDAETLIHELGVHGHLQFRGLLSGQSRTPRLGQKDFAES